MTPLGTENVAKVSECASVNLINYIGVSKHKWMSHNIINTHQTHCHHNMHQTHCHHNMHQTHCHHNSQSFCQIDLKCLPEIW
jgi:hypothetical protein